MATLLPSHSFIRPTPVEIARPIGFYKGLVFDSLAVLVSVLTSYLYRRYLDGGGGVTLPLLSLSLFLILSLLGTFFTKEFNRRLLILALQSIGLLAFFYDEHFVILAAAFGITLLFFLLGESLGRLELRNSLQVKFFKVAKITLSRVITGIAFFAIILYIPRINPQEFFIPREAFRSFFQEVAKFTRTVYPDINLTASVGTLTENLARAEAESNPVFKTLSVAEQEELIVETSQQLLVNLKKSFKMEINAKESVSDVLYDFVGRAVSEWRERFGKLSTLGFVGALFVFLRSIGVMFYWFLTLVGWFLYQLLLAFNFVHMTSESRSKEVLEYS